MYTLKKLTRMHEAAIMIRDYKLLIELHHMNMVQVLEKYAKLSN